MSVQRLIRWCTKNNKMKTFNRSSLPESINYNGKKYIYTVNKTVDSIQVNVLSRSLKGRTDLYGHAYQPTKHYFKPEN